MCDLQALESQEDRSSNGAPEAGELCSRPEVGIPTLAEYLSKAQSGTARRSERPRKVAGFITEAWIRERCEDDCGCLIWQNQVSRDGAPVAWSPLIDGKRFRVQVRRAAWELRNGPIPQGGRLSYSCTNPRCLTCLKLVTFSEVNQRNWDKPDVRARKVASITKASRKRGKIDMDKAREIRASTETLEKVSKRLGISMTLASQVRRGIAWKEDRNPFAGLGA